MVVRERIAAAYIGTSVSLLQKARVRGDGPAFVRLGARAVGYRIADLDAWTASRRVSSTSERPRPLPTGRPLQEHHDGDGSRRPTVRASSA